MYEAYYGFRERPFSLIPDPDFLYLSRGHAMALSLLEYGLTEQTGFVVISGEVGSGKTTLVRRLLNDASDDLTVGLITNTHRSFGELLQWISLAFDLDYRGKDKVQLYQDFVDFMLDQYAAGRRVVLIIDEGQNLEVDALEELRMLSNVNAGKDYLLQVVVVGQPELLEKLRRPELRQFVQRISVDHHLNPMELKDTIGYIRHRLEVAGGDPAIFDELACCAVQYFSGGVPRLINILCDHSLVYGFAEDKPRIDIDTVIDVAEDRRHSGLGPFRSDGEGASRDEIKTLIKRSSIVSLDNGRDMKAAAK
jgi:type II secretory pathway predicted ATPase ExeA